MTSRIIRKRKPKPQVAVSSHLFERLLQANEGEGAVRPRRKRDPHTDSGDAGFFGKFKAELPRELAAPLRAPTVRAPGSVRPESRWDTQRRRAAGHAGPQSPSSPQPLRTRSQSLGFVTPNSAGPVTRVPLLTGTGKVVPPAPGRDWKWRGAVRTPREGRTRERPWQT